MTPQNVDREELARIFVRILKRLADILECNCVEDHEKALRLSALDIRYLAEEIEHGL